MNTMNEVQLYTGSAGQNYQAPGGWAATIWKDETKLMEAAGGAPGTTKLRMEMIAVTKGLEALKRPSQVILFTENVCLDQSLRKPKAREDDLWRSLDFILKEHEIVYTHSLWSGENECCNQLAEVKRQTAREVFQAFCKSQEDKYRQVIYPPVNSEIFCIREPNK